MMQFQNSYIIRHALHLFLPWLCLIKECNIRKLFNALLNQV